MVVATYIVLVMGILGATDVLLYHSVSHGIRTHRDSRRELIFHSLRGPTYAALFVLVPNFAMHGLFFWMLLAILAVDVALSLGDFMVERASRALLGGLPTGEYVLHVLLAMLFGALVTSVLHDAGHWRTLPTQLAYDPAAVPAWVRGLLVVMAASVLVSGALDALAALRLFRRTQGPARDPGSFPEPGRPAPGPAGNEAHPGR